jgi:hypothetical protein
MANSCGFSMLGTAALLSILLSGCGFSVPYATPTPTPVPVPTVSPVQPPVLGILYAAETQGMVGRVVPAGKSTTTYVITSILLFNEASPGGGGGVLIANLKTPITVLLNPPVQANLTSDQVQDHPTYGETYAGVPVLPSDGPHEFIIPFSALTRIQASYANNLKAGCQICFGCQDPKNPSSFYQSRPYTITPPPPTPQTILADNGSYQVQGTFDTSGVTGLTSAQRVSLSQKLYQDGLKALDPLLSPWSLTASACNGTNGPRILVNGMYRGTGYQSDLMRKLTDALEQVASRAGVAGVDLKGFAFIPNGPADRDLYVGTSPAGKLFHVSVSLHVVATATGNARGSILNSANQDLLSSLGQVADTTLTSTTAMTDATDDMVVVFKGKSKQAQSVGTTLKALRDTVLTTMASRSKDVVVTSLTAQDVDAGPTP